MIHALLSKFMDLGSPEQPQLICRIALSWSADMAPPDSDKYSSALSSPLVNPGNLLGLESNEVSLGCLALDPSLHSLDAEISVWYAPTCER